MNIEIANRLFEYRKKNNLSQEELAEKLGISRQAVSKWERAESSPDTDNLINLSVLYGVSLDELINGNPKKTTTDEPIKNDDNTNKNNENNGIGFSGFGTGTNSDETNKTENKDGFQEKTFYNDGKTHVKIGFSGIVVEDGDDKVYVGPKGVHVYDGKEEIHIGKHINSRGKRMLADIPYSIFATIGFFLLMYFGYAHPGWLIFMTIPLFHGAVSAIVNRNMNNFPYPVLCAGIYLVVGFMYHMWHPTWLIFLTIPIYYWLFSKKY